MRTRTGRHRLAVLLVYLLLVIVTGLVLGSRFVTAHELSSSMPRATAAGAEGE